MITFFFSGCLNLHWIKKPFLTAWVDFRVAIFLTCPFIKDHAFNGVSKHKFNKIIFNYTILLSLLMPLSQRSFKSLLIIKFDMYVVTVNGFWALEVKDGSILCA